MVNNFGLFSECLCTTDTTTTVNAQHTPPQWLVTSACSQWTFAASAQWLVCTFSMFSEYFCTTITKTTMANTFSLLLRVFLLLPRSTSNTTMGHIWDHQVIWDSPVIWDSLSTTRSFETLYQPNGWFETLSTTTRSETLYGLETPHVIWHTLTERNRNPQADDKQYLVTLWYEKTQINKQVI